MKHDRVRTAFRIAREQGRTAVMPYVTAGDPPGIRLGDLLLALQSGGADVIEIGIPFSDPIADGPVIASAMYRALEQGVTPGKVFSEIAELRDSLDVALVAMVSMSIVATVGVDSFVRSAGECGLDGLIVPDADLEHLSRLEGACHHEGLSLTSLVAPSTTEGRIERIARHSTGFVYLLARAGVTGARSEAPDVEDRVRTLRSFTDLPIGVGFGISTAEHVQEIGKHADGAIVGSALVSYLHEIDRQGGDVLASARRFVEDLRQVSF